MSESSPRILITRLSHIGDCVLTLPMLFAIKKKFPSSFVAWAVESPTQKLLTEVSEIDELIVVPKRWMNKLSHWRKLRRQLCELKFDYVIDPQSITKSAMLGRISGAKTRIGMGGPWARECTPWLNNVRVEIKQRHLVDRSLELLSELGIENPGIRLELPFSAESRDSVENMLVNLDAEEFALINPGASWPSKRWETGRFGSVANRLFEVHNLRSIICWAGEDELEMANEIHESAPAATLIAPATTLPELAALCSRAKFFIGCDTGPMHIAAAVQTPCVGLYGPTLPGDSGAYGRHHVHVQKWHQTGTSRQRRSAANLAMRRHFRGGRQLGNRSNDEKSGEIKEFKRGLETREKQRCGKKLKSNLAAEKSQREILRSYLTQNDNVWTMPVQHAFSERLI